MTARLTLEPSTLRTARLERGLSQVDLWQLSGVHHVTIARIETGKANASLSTIRRLATALGMPITELAEVTEQERATA